MSTPGPPANQSWTWLARIRRPQGRRGEVFADILTDFPERFAQRRQLWLVPDAPSATVQPRAVELVAHWLHKGGVVLHFSGIDSISDAETLQGLTVAIPQSERAPLGEDEAYIGDLIGCTLVDLAPNPPAEIGKISDVDRTAGPTPLIVVQTPRGEALIPFAKAYLRRLDLENKRVEMALPEGLLDLNA
jgi:16S rRNA processing protein RimM